MAMFRLSVAFMVKAICEGLSPLKNWFSFFLVLYRFRDA